MHQYSILIADDSTMMRKVVRKYIGLDHVLITEAADGSEALKLTLEKKFDLIISDIDMPELDGFNFCQKLKKNPLTRKTPVLILSSFESDNEIDKGFQAGATAYVFKEDIKTELKKIVKKVLVKKKIQNNQVVLVVDDSPSIRKIVEEGLSKAGYQIVTAQNGMEALEKISIKKPDLILSDIDMPVMNGFDFCYKVKKSSTYKAIPFIVMSTNSSRGHMKRMLSIGAETYITKPFNLDQLVIMIEKLLSDQYILLLKEKERIESEKNIMLDSITSLVTALEARDPYTKGHSDSVSNIVKGMAEIMGATPDEVELITVGAKLHDIGKIGISDNILLKPGPLKDNEYEIIKQHTTIGENILKPVKSFEDLIPIVRDHHEKYDGTGYPNGLKGEEIHLWARMTSVADTFHALTSIRPYRNKKKINDAMVIINGLKGTQLCPYCVDLLNDLLSGDRTAQKNDYVLTSDTAKKPSISVVNG